MTQHTEQQGEGQAEGEGEQQPEVSTGPSPARLQVLTLPSQQVGEVTEYPFTFVLSEMDVRMTVQEAEVLAHWARECGATGMLIVPFAIKVE